MNERARMQPNPKTMPVSRRAKIASAENDPLSLNNARIDPLMTIADVQRVTKIGHKSTVYRLIQKGVLPPPLKIGSSSRWPTSWIVGFVEDLKHAQQGDKR